MARKFTIILKITRESILMPKIPRCVILFTLSLLTLVSCSAPKKTSDHAVVLGLVGDQHPNLCEIAKRDEIWLAKPPYNNPQPLLAAADKDYRYPTWSPDGQWLAYIEAKTSLVSDTNFKPDMTIPGVDSVWVMRPDGSEKHRVGENVPDGMVSFIMGMNIACNPFSFIIFTPQWSPDGRYILYVRAWSEEGSKWKHTYYLTEVSTGKTKNLLTQTALNEAVWMSDQRILIPGDDSVFQQVTFESIDNIHTETIPFTLPPGIKVDYDDYEFTKASADNTLYGFFASGGTYTSPIPTEMTVWEYNLTTRAWVQRADIKKETWSRPQIIKDQMVQWDEKNYLIALFDFQTGQQTGKIQLAANTEKAEMKAITDETGKTLLAFRSYKPAHTIYLINLQDTSAKPVILFQNAPFPSTKVLSAFDFQP